MKRSWIIVTITVALFVAMASPAATQPATPDGVAEGAPDGDVRSTDELEAAASTPARTGRLLGRPDTSGPSTWLIRFVDPAVPSYEGGKGGLERTAPAPGQSARHEQRARAGVPPAPARPPRPTSSSGWSGPSTATSRSRSPYQFAVNGMAAVLTLEEATRARRRPGRGHDRADKERELHTDVGPQWINADALWNAVEELGLPDGRPRRGHRHRHHRHRHQPEQPLVRRRRRRRLRPHQPARGGQLPRCLQPGQPGRGRRFDPTFPCNDKLIGAYDFLGDRRRQRSRLRRPRLPHRLHLRRQRGRRRRRHHGSGFVTPAVRHLRRRPARQRHRLPRLLQPGGLTASIDQAIADEVDVINYSIGSSAPSAAWDDFDTLGFLNARAAGIFVATSNGNDGPNAATTGSPADAPWLTSVGASTHNRHNGNALTDLDSSTGRSPTSRASRSPARCTSTPIVDAADVGDPFCLDDTGHEAEFTGNIVVCARRRRQRSGGEVPDVAAQGAVGFVLTNDDGARATRCSATSTRSPACSSPTPTAQMLKAWLADRHRPRGRHRRHHLRHRRPRADIMASFSSRGPNRAIDTISPRSPRRASTSWPPSASTTPTRRSTASSRARRCPARTSPAPARCSARPGRTGRPAQQQSALMTTARTDGPQPRRRRRPRRSRRAPATSTSARATLAGLLFDETLRRLPGRQPGRGRRPQDAQPAVVRQPQCLAVCTLGARRPRCPTTADAPVPADVTWTATPPADDGLDLEVDAVSQATVSPGDTHGHHGHRRRERPPRSARRCSAGSRSPRATRRARP